MASSIVSRSRTHSTSEGPRLRLPDTPQRDLRDVRDRPQSPKSMSHSAAAATSSPSTTTSTSTSTTTARRDRRLSPTPGPTSLAAWGGTFLVADDPPPPPNPPNPPSHRSAHARESFLSIVDDPFFLRYHAACDALGVGVPASKQPDQPPPRHEPFAPAATTTTTITAWPPPRRESLSITSPTPWSSSPTALASAAAPASAPLPAPTRNRMETINIAVIGSNGVGKSAFVQRALRMARPPTMNSNAVIWPFEGISLVVTLIELDLEGFDVDPSQPIRWPKQINGHMVPRIDAALILYDVMNRDSIRELPHAVSALGNSALPTILVATKCDNPDEFRQLNADGMANAFPSILADFKTSANVPGSTRDCLQAIIRAAVSNRRGGDKSDAATRRRAASSAAHLDAPLDSANGSRPLSDHSSKHSRASSDLSLLRGYPPPSSSTDREAYYRTQNSRSPRIDFPNASSLAASSFGTEMTDENQNTVSGMLRTTGVRIDTSQDSFLDVEESDAESYRYSDDIPILQRNDDSFLDKPPKSKGMSFDELAERLLAPRMTRADNNFADVFLCLYRKFAAPGELFAAITAHLESVKEDKTAHYLAKTTTQLRVIEVIAKWVQSYPGDFARPATRRALEDLIARLAAEPIFSAAAQQMREHLEHDVMEDDDTAWAHCDEPQPEPGREPPKRWSDLRESMRSLRMEDSRSSDPSASFDSGHTESEGGGTASFPAHFQFHSYDDYEREAVTMVPTPIYPLNKNRYHIFMGLDAEDLADEITRIDWVLFSSIRIRDLVRHVSLPLELKEKCRSLKNVNRMIAHFNHVAKWVANTILIRDKAKHRAPCLQQFMAVALRLRQLNNYNGLAAVLAGINGTAVHRLSATRALVDPDLQKRFARLVLLMGTQKSHFAYRLAWENSPLPRIPFMPLHRRDLVSAEEGSRTFVGPQGDRINWKKFEVLGEVLLPVMKSQGTPYPNLRKHDQSRELILDCRMPVDDEEIYQRSIQVEPNSGPSDTGKKKFPWLAK